NYALYAAEDEKRFVNLQNAQAHVINRLKKWLDAEYPGTRIEFCPPWYSNEHIDRGDGKAEVYFRELTLQIPRDVAIIWTGPTIRSLSIDMADLHRYSTLIGRWPMIWDNTLYARNIETKRYGGYTTHYPGKVKMCNLFEPYDADMPEDFHVFNDGRQRYTNGNAYSEIYRIKYATVADYEWNTAAYDPERSLWKTLCRTYGAALAEQLIRFSDAYYGVYGICLRMERQGAADSDVESGRKSLTDLDACLLAVSRALPGGHPLTVELNRFRDAQKARFEKLSQGAGGNGVTAGT
ncbi:MAG TPA: beta-N-acetylglucosaminidase domain-containing protein, partial [Desulfosarcina sp.]|nr:beta-N-acetylglucosaminidase domain-containing protein [Desulfosarcina sp.]